MTYMVWFGEYMFKFDSRETMIAAIAHAPKDWPIHIRGTVVFDRMTK